MGLLDHRELMIVKGIGKTPGDTNSAEQNPVSINLMDTADGFSLIEWSPNIASLKGGGVWADSPISDGRTLVSGQNTNVTETIVINLVGSNYQLYTTRFASLRRMIQDARALWTSVVQIEPVYLQWWADGAPDRQYALIYNIDMDVQVQDSSQFCAQITLSVEREYGWRGVKPGGNPKEWTYYVRGEPYNSSKAALDTGTDHVVAQTIQNRREWNAAQTALLSQNHITIPASAIPGDLEALTEIYCEYSNLGSMSVGQLFIGRDTKPALPNGSGVIMPANYILNAADAANFGSDTTTQADTGAPLSTGAATATRGRVAFVTLTNVLRFQWSNNGRGYFDLNLNRGRFACFLRARLSAAGTVTVNLAQSVNSVRQTYPTQTLTSTGSGGTGNTTSWAVTYMGVVDVPFAEARAEVNDNGLGMYALGSGNGHNLALDAARISGTPELYVADLVMIPIDEYGCAIYSPASPPGNGNAHIFDSTGYYAHGILGDLSRTDNNPNTELRGQGIRLLPGVENQLHFLATTNFTPPETNLPATFAIKLNIVPRWSGVRDA